MSKEITNVSIDVLKVHPRNLEFFDNISGDEYEKFKKINTGRRNYIRDNS